MSADRVCRDVDDALAELAVGTVDEPERGRLLAHVEACPACRARLDTVSAAADDVLLLAPEVEPPPGFEARVLARLQAPATRRRPWFAVVAAAVAIVVGLAAGLALGRSSDPAASRERSARVVATTGSEVGSVLLRAEPRPMVVLTADAPRQWSGERTCLLVLPDGSTLDAGSWGYADVVGGVWAAGIDPRGLDATAMRVVDERGTILATATF